MRITLGNFLCHRPVAIFCAATTMLLYAFPSEGQEQSQSTFAERFAAANTTHDGCITFAQARVAKMWYLVTLFPAVDAQQQGCVTLTQIHEYQKEQRRTVTPKSDNTVAARDVTPAPAPKEDVTQAPTPREAASQEMADLLAGAIKRDSSAWAFNKYDSGSLHNVVVTNRWPEGQVGVKGYYTFNGGSAGWVEARINKGEVECLLYWDNQGCAPVRTQKAYTPNHDVEDYQEQKRAQHQYCEDQMEERGLSGAYCPQ